MHCVEHLRCFIALLWDALSAGFENEQILSTQRTLGFWASKHCTNLAIAIKDTEVAVPLLAAHLAASLSNQAVTDQLPISCFYSKRVAK